MRRATGLQTAFRSGWELWTGDRDKRRHVWRARNPLRFPIYRFCRATVPATCMKMLGASYEPLIPISGNAYTAYSGRISADCGYRANGRSRVSPTPNALLNSLEDRFVSPATGRRQILRTSPDPLSWLERLYGS